MKKLLFLSLLIFLLSSCSDNQTSIKENNTGSILEKNEQIVSEKEEVSRQEKINELRKKIAIKWLISKWNINIQNKDYTSALIKYLQIIKEIPNDKETLVKLWDIYFSLKKFKQSYYYYSKVIWYKRLDNNKVATTLLFSTPLTKENTGTLNLKLDLLDLSEQELFYYKNSVICSDDFSLCIKNFNDFFDKKEEEKKSIIENYTWTWEVKLEDEFEDLYNIKKYFQTYENFQVDDLFYKWALVSAAFYENWLYNVAIQTSKKILEEKKNYKPLLKIVAKSYYELWNYIEAKLYILKYNKIVKNDKEASYFLWVIYERLNEYMLSTIHLKKALKIWYEEDLDINKRLLYNYYKLDQIEKMLEMLAVIINNNTDELKLNDYSLAIYYHIIYDKLDEAEVISRKALKLFSKSEVINWYMWWILMEQVNKKNTVSNIIGKKYKINKDLYKNAEVYINRWLEINKYSPMLNLVKWKLELNKWKEKKAVTYFEKTVSLDNYWDFWKIAKKELKILEEK